MSDAGNATAGLPDDHPFSGRRGPATMRDAINARLVGNTTPTGSRAELAAATRIIIDELMRSTADDVQLEDAAALVTQAAALLQEQSHGRGYVGVAEGSLANGHQSFIDFSPFIGVLNPLAPPISVRFDAKGDVTATCTYGAAYEGPPGCVHGGIIAGLFDEILGIANIAAGVGAMTGTLKIVYRSPTPLYTELQFEGRTERIDGRKVYTAGTLHAGERLCAEADGIFILVEHDRFVDQTRLHGGGGPT